MKEYPEIINDPKASAEARLQALRQYEIERTAISAPTRLASPTSEINNHVHTIYSFSPYTPSMAALRSRDAGLAAAGSVDHDSISAAEEMVAACAAVGIGGCVGFEVRVSFKLDAKGKKSAFADRKINNPDSPGLVYMTVQGVPSSAITAVKSFLTPIQKRREQRTQEMTRASNVLLKAAGLRELDFEKDVRGISKAIEGGGLTERHLLSAVVGTLIEKYGRGKALVAALPSLGLTVPAKIIPLLEDANNPHYLFDLLGLLKTTFLTRVFIQPDDEECISAQKVVDFARSIGAISAYAYLGDVGESPTGDKKAEKFEDDYLDELFIELKRIGYKAVTYMPPRNSVQQLLRVQKLCAQHGFMEISGVDINSSRQSFNCPEVLKPEFRHLVDTTWALIAHERLSSIDKNLDLFSSNNPVSSHSLEKRIATYARAAHELDLHHPEASAKEVAEKLRKGMYTE